MKKQKKVFSLKKEYKKCKEFFAEFQKHVVFALALFSVSFLVGLIFPVFFRERIIEFIQNLALAIQGLSPLEIVTFIFFNNVKASLAAFVLGIFVGLFPFITTVANGYIVGFVANGAIYAEGIFVLWRLIPHGIFELPAIFLSIGLGFKLGFDMFKSDPVRRTKRNLIEGMRFFVLIILPLLIVAAIIEGLLIGFGV